MIKERRLHPSHMQSDKQGEIFKLWKIVLGVVVELFGFRSPSSYFSQSLDPTQPEFVETLIKYNIQGWAGPMFTYGLFGFEELGGSEEVRSVFFHFRCSFKHRKRKMQKVLFLFSSLFYTTIFLLPECYN